MQKPYYNQSRKISQIAEDTVNLSVARAQVHRQHSQTNSSIASSFKTCDTAHSSPAHSGGSPDSTSKKQKSK